MKFASLYCLDFTKQVTELHALCSDKPDSLFAWTEERALK